MNNYLFLLFYFTLYIYLFLLFYMSVHLFIKYGRIGIPYWGAYEGILMGTEMLLMHSNIAGKTIFSN